MARGIWKGNPDRALLAERARLEAALDLSAREWFEVRSEERARAAEGGGSDD